MHCSGGIHVASKNNNIHVTITKKCLAYILGTVKVKNVWFYNGIRSRILSVPVWLGLILPLFYCISLFTCLLYVSIHFSLHGIVFCLAWLTFTWCQDLLSHTIHDIYLTVPMMWDGYTQEIPPRKNAKKLSRPMYSGVRNAMEQ